MHLGQSAVAKPLSNSNGSRPAIYAYPVQSTSQAGTKHVSELSTTEVTSSMTTAGTQPPAPVAILQTALSGDHSMGPHLTGCLQFWKTQGISSFWKTQGILSMHREFL